MTTRSSKTTATFTRPFSMPSLETPQPAGDYLVETDEEQIENISFLAWRRIATLLHLPAIGTATGVAQIVAIDPEELKAALVRDVTPERRAIRVPPL